FLITPEVVAIHKLLFLSLKKLKGVPISDTNCCRLMALLRSIPFPLLNTLIFVSWVEPTHISLFTVAAQLTEPNDTSLFNLSLAIYIEMLLRLGSNRPKPILL